LTNLNAELGTWKEEKERWKEEGEVEVVSLIHRSQIGGELVERP